ncbi:hypothetical protein GDO81_016563 [Engystomops pustulosus]|uniref:Uncharacterized protein n=1 Tax=Engystomops pustulosus TaxID=76066 RepID=A0AAV7B2I1_ENGPU|nr:hypothetical protein GDO81_016563 [Engystomops pustulosus]
METFILDFHRGQGRSLLALRLCVHHVSHYEGEINDCKQRFYKLYIVFRWFLIFMLAVSEEDPAQLTYTGACSSHYNCTESRDLYTPTLYWWLLVSKNSACFRGMGKTSQLPYTGTLLVTRQSSKSNYKG